jgi:hypothetical protein
MADRDEALPHLGELEQAVIGVLWQRQQAAVREVVPLHAGPLGVSEVTRIAATMPSNVLYPGRSLRAQNGLTVLLGALCVLVSARQPGTVVTSPYRWYREDYRLIRQQ